MQEQLPAVGPMTATWVDFFIMAGVFVLIAIGALIWVLYFRKRGRRRRHKPRHRRERRSTNPTLAQTGGLPPARPTPPSDGRSSQTP